MSRPVGGGSFSWLDLDGDGDLVPRRKDFNNDCTINFADLGFMKAMFLTGNPEADINGDGFVNFIDLGRLKQAFFTAPGPSGVPNLCDRRSVGSSVATALLFLAADELTRLPAQRPQTTGYVEVRIPPIEGSAQHAPMDRRKPSRSRAPRRRIRRILVAVKDPASRSLPVVDRAAQLAGALGAGIELFYTIDTLVHVDALRLRNGGLKTLERSARELRLEQLELIAARLRRQGIEVRTAVEWDYPIHESIIRRAARIGAGLIVAACHGGRHLAPSLLRIPDWELLRLSPMPVLVVKGRRAYRQPVVLAALDPTHAFAKPARLDEEILRIGETVAGGLHGKLHALHAYSPIPEELPPEIWSAADVTAAVTSRARAAAKVGLDRSLKGRSIPRARRHLVGTHPVNAIPDVARRTKAAIVVMGAISRSGIRSLFIGNTAERVLDALECDLLVVKPRGCVNRVPRAKRGMRLAMSAPISW